MVYHIIEKSQIEERLQVLSLKYEALHETALNVCSQWHGSSA